MIEESSEPRNREPDPSALKLSRLGVFGGAFYILLGGIALFFVGRYFGRGAPGPLWVSALGVFSVGGTLAMGGWMIRTGLRNPTEKTAALFRHYASFAVASVLLAPLEILDVVQGPVMFGIAAAAFLATEALINRWIGRPPSRRVGEGISKNLIEP